MQFTVDERNIQTCETCSKRSVSSLVGGKTTSLADIVLKTELIKSENITVHPMFVDGKEAGINWRHVS